MPTAKAFPLQRELIDSVIAFANASITRPLDVPPLFAAGYQPSPNALPDLTQCRRIQTEVRRWLTDKQASLPVGAMLDVRLVGALGFSASNRTGAMAYEITWQWWFDKNTPLRALCGLAVASIYHAGLRDFAGQCAREGCDTFYVDHDSRGIPRKYCRTEECDKALNRERVAKSRMKPRKHR